MALLVKADLYQNMYQEIVEEISRNDNSHITKALARGETQVMSYLNRFDKTLMFGGSYREDYLISICVDVVCWHLVKLANPNVNLELFKTVYDDALKELDKIQNGKTSPGWPLKPDNPATPIAEGGILVWSSNTKRNNHY